MILSLSTASMAQDKQGPSGEWDKVVEAAQKEGKVVVSIPSSADLRTSLEKAFKQRFGIQVESVVARGSASVRKIVEKARAGVRYFDVHMGGSESIVSGLLPEGVLAPVAEAGERAGSGVGTKAPGTINHDQVSDEVTVS